MRLVCPNCDARYEVPDDAIPDGGRDVQCSACGHAWFQLRPEAEIAAAEEAALFGDDLPVPADETPPALEAAAEAPRKTPVAAVEDEKADEVGTDDAALAAAIGAAVAGTAIPGSTPPRAPAAAPSPVTPPRRELDEDVLAVLREEAGREAEARRAEAQRAGTRKADAEGQMQVQPDLGMDAAPVGGALSPTQRRLAMLKGEDPDAQPPELAKPAARRDLLPDVEEINSTLQPGDAAALDAEIDALPDLTRRRSSFRSGFFLVILLMVIAAAVYVMAPKLSAQFPSLQDPMDRYVAFVDGLRLWLNDVMNSATDKLNGEG